MRKLFSLLLTIAVAPVMLLSQAASPGAEGSHRPRQVAGARHALCAASRRCARAPHRGVRQDDVLGRVHHRPRSGLRGRERRLLHQPVRRAREGRQAGRSTAPRRPCTSPCRTARVRTARYLGDQGCVDAAGRQDGAELHAHAHAERHAAEPVDAAGPRATPCRRGPAGRRCGQAEAGGGRRVRPRRGAHRGAAIVTGGASSSPSATARASRRTTPLESWSMGKSLTATLMGMLIRAAAPTSSWQPAPIPEWQTPGDPRAKIRIADILHMSSGLRIRAPQDPDYDAPGPYPDHLYLYTGAVDAYRYAATRPQQWPPDTVGRYRNTDPVLTSYLMRLAVEKRGEDYLSFPQRALFDKLGIRTMVLETDPHGNFLTPGLRARLGPRLGPPRQPLPAGRRLERRAPAARRLREVREHASRPRGKPTSGPSTAASSGSTATARSPCPARPITCPAPAARRR